MNEHADFVILHKCGGNLSCIAIGIEEDIDAILATLHNLNPDNADDFIKEAINPADNIDMNTSSKELTRIFKNLV